MFIHIFFFLSNIKLELFDIYNTESLQVRLDQPFYIDINHASAIHTQYMYVVFIHFNTFPNS